MTVTYHRDLTQGSIEWFAARCGVLTASEIPLLITAKKMEYSAGEKEKNHLFNIAAQRVTKYVEPTFQSNIMMNAHTAESDARITYSDHYAYADECGFITNDKWGFTLGYSPDGLVGDDGLIECKMRGQKYQFETIINNKMPDDYLIQVQGGLLISERKWCDFISYNGGDKYLGGMPMFTHRIYADEIVQNAIVKAAQIFHERLDAMLKIYEDRLNDKEIRLIKTERSIEEEIKAS